MMGRRGGSVFLASIVGLLSFWAFAQPKIDDPLAPFRGYNLSLNPSDEALKKLIELHDAQKDPQIQSQMAFALGVITFKKGDKNRAASFLGESIQLKTHLDDFAHYYIGQIERDNKDLHGAKLHFTSVQTHFPQSPLEAEAEVQLTQIAKSQGKWSEAFSILIHLERRHRHDPQYQDILYSLIEAAFEEHHTSEACRAAVKLYSSFAAYSVTKGWGFDLSKAQVAGHPLKCPVNLKDQTRRMERLLLAGEFEEIQTELKEWEALPNKKKDSQGQLEMAWGQLLLAEGKTKEAIAHFTMAQAYLKDNQNLQMALSKAYAQNDDYPAAVENYLKASRMGPRRARRVTLAQKALFQAAFLSYEYRNYDGASRLFEEISSENRGPLAWDARWHLAWIRYLKQDYAGAKKEFLQLSQNKQFSAVDLEKLQYWRAMAELRDGNVSEARNLFTELSTHPRLGYYSGAATARLGEMAPVTDPKNVPSTAAPPKKSNSVLESIKLVVSNALGRRPASEEGVPIEKEIEKLDNMPEATEDEEGVTSGFELGPPITSLKSSSLMERFERAKAFVDLGFNAWAIVELREIEKRTTNRTYLQSLMTEYAKAGEYFRSATIADNIFETERIQGGLSGASNFWTYAFPQAYARFVLADSKRVDLSSSLVWAVMRGESGFREDIHSAAGAIGLMQLIPITAKKVAKSAGIDDFKNLMLIQPDTNILLGSKYLKRLDRVMDHNIPLVIASYNAGPHRVQGWLKDFGDLDFDEFIEHIPYIETRNYVKKVLRNYFVYETLYSKNANVLKFVAQKPTIKFTGPKPTSESWDELN